MNNYANSCVEDYGNGGMITMPCSSFTEDQIRLMFRAAIANCPESMNARQKYVTEERGGYVFLQIISTFKLKAE